MTTSSEFQDKTYFVAVQLRLLDNYNPKQKEMRDNQAHKIYMSFSHPEIDNLIRDLDIEISYHRNGNETPETQKDLRNLSRLVKGLSFSCI